MTALAFKWGKVIKIKLISRITYNINCYQITKKANMFLRW